MANFALFVPPPRIDPAELLPIAEQRKHADARLSSAPGGWPDEIVQNLLREHPYIPPERVAVNFRQKDDAKGYAIGFISITGAPQLSIPVIITQQMLKPLDILVLRKDSGGTAEQAVGNFSDDKVMPLTESTFNDALDLGPIGDPVNPAEIRGSGWTEDGSGLRLPYRGRTVVAHVIGATEAKKAELDAVLRADKSIVSGFAINCPEILEEWLKAPAPGDALRVKMASQTIAPISVETIADAPIEKPLESVLGAVVWMEPGITKAAALCKCISLSNPLLDSLYLLFDDGSFCPAPTKVAVVDGGQSENDLVGRVYQKISSRQFAEGDWVSFYVNEAFTEPAKIASLSISSQYINLRLVDALGIGHPASFGKTVKVAVMGDNGGWVMPLDTPVLRFNSTESVPMDPGKVASVLGHLLPNRLAMAEGQFVLQLEDGRTLGVEAVSETKCAELLRPWFTNADLLIEAAKTASTGGVRFKSNLVDVMRELEAKTATYQGLSKVAKPFLDAVCVPMAQAAKLAAAMSDPEGADAVLSTGFLTEDNLAEFAGLSECFDGVISKLARLLLLIRMGYPEGDESATLVAMKSLQRVMESLRGLRSE